MKAAQKERKVLAREAPGELEVSRLEGGFLFDNKGKKYVDFVAGWCVGNLGWSNPDLVREIQRFKGPDYVYPDYSYKGWTELANLLASISPGKLTKSFRATGGSEAIDLAMQAALVHTRRRAFISIEDSYHGNSLAGLSIGASDNREQCPNLLRYCYKVSPPLDETALQKIETRLKKRDVAAFIMEPISINLAVLVPSNSFMQELQRLCRKYGTLLIADEVATGFGRTGRMFACEHFDLQPDIMCLAKAITGGILGLGATVTTSAVAKSMEEKGSFYSTYGWHPRSTHAALLTVRYFIRHKKELLEQIAVTSTYFRSRLSRISFKQKVTIRIQGLAVAVDLHSEEDASNLQTKCRRGGLLITAEGSAVLLLPTLNISREVAKRGLDILEMCA